MSYKAIQQKFIQQLVKGAQTEHEFVAYLKPCGNLNPTQQLAIYQNNVRTALQKTLAQVYPVCQKILGEKYFEQLARLYITDTPSTQGDLNQYGGFFPDFIHVQSLQRDELVEFPYLGDLAKLEWLRHKIYYAAEGVDFDFLTFEKLNEQQQAQTVFLLSPCLAFVQSKHPIQSIWQMNQQNNQKAVIAKEESCCIFRKENAINMIAINSEANQLLTLITQRATLEEIVQTGCANCLPEFIHSGWIDSFQVDNV